MGGRGHWVWYRGRGSSRFLFTTNGNYIKHHTKDSSKPIREVHVINPSLHLWADLLGRWNTAEEVLQEVDQGWEWKSNMVEIKKSFYSLRTGRCLFAAEGMHTYLTFYIFLTHLIVLWSSCSHCLLSVLPSSNVYCFIVIYSAVLFTSVFILFCIWWLIYPKVVPKFIHHYYFYIIFTSFL